MERAAPDYSAANTHGSTLNHDGLNRDLRTAFGGLFVSISVLATGIDAGQNSRRLSRVGTEGQEMISWRYAVPTILAAAVVAAVVAACIANAISSVVLPQLVEASQRRPLILPKTSNHDTTISANNKHPSSEYHVTAYQQAAEAILQRAQNAMASSDVPIMTGDIPLPKGQVPLPKKRPIPRL